MPRSAVLAHWLLRPLARPEACKKSVPRSAVLAHWLLHERLNVFCVLGCVLCIVGSVTIVLHAPEEQPITSLLQVWRLAQQPGAALIRCTNNLI